MRLPRKFKEEAYDTLSLGADWVPGILPPLISNLVLSEDNIYQIIDKKLPAIATRIQKDSSTENNITLVSKVIFPQNTATYKQVGSRVKLEFLLENVPDLPYKRFIDENERLCKNLASISLEKSRDNQNQLLLDYKQTFENCRQLSKNINALDARDLAFPSSVKINKPELPVENLNDTLLVLFDKLLEDECKEWERKITSDFESIRIEALKKRSEALKEFYISCINKIKQEKELDISHPTFSNEKIQNFTPDTSQTASLTEEETFPLSYLQSCLSEVSPDYKAIIENEVINMYLMYLKENSSSKK